MRASLPTEKRILVDELYKILYFNNMDPETYTISFWADHFKISPGAMRNMMNYVAYPLTDPDTKQITETLFFIDSELMQQQQSLLTELNRDNYLRYLASDYSNRMVEQHKEETGLFGKIHPSFEL